MTWLDRQGFLGEESAAILDGLTVGLVGLGGGNSHVVQQLAHLGVGGFVLVDDDVITETNLNRLVGGTRDDLTCAREKTEIAERIIRAVNPYARISSRQAKWQEVGDQLRCCDIIVGGLDRLIAKSELEAFCRRLLIPYIDMGMDVHRLGETHEFLVAGQVVLSFPGEPCLRCLGIINDDQLAAEARQYGDAGGKPQVVWPNGMLASAAVGLLVQLFTPWHASRRKSAYFAYDANQGTMVEADRMRRRKQMACQHYPSGATGDPTFDVRKMLDRSEDREIAPGAQPAPACQPGFRKWIRRMLRW